MRFPPAPRAVDRTVAWERATGDAPRSIGCRGAGDALARARAMGVPTQANVSPMLQQLLLPLAVRLCVGGLSLSGAPPCYWPNLCFNGPSFGGTDNVLSATACQQLCKAWVPAPTRCEYWFWQGDAKHCRMFDTLPSNSTEPAKV